MIYALCGYAAGFLLLKTGKNVQKNIIKALTAVFPLSEAVKLLIMIFTGEFTVWYFPFQLCSMPVYMMPLRRIFGKNKRVKKRIDSFIVCFFLLGGTMAFFDTSGMIYHIPLLTFQSFAWHMLMIVTGILICAENECDIKFDYAVGIYLVCCVIATFINVALHSFGEVNMFYISPYVNMTQIVFADIGRESGQTLARNLYIIMSVVGALIIYRVTDVIRRVKVSRLS